MLSSSEQEFIVLETLVLHNTKYCMCTHCHAHTYIHDIRVYVLTYFMKSTSLPSTLTHTILAFQLLATVVWTELLYTYT